MITYRYEKKKPEKCSQVEICSSYHNAGNILGIFHWDSWDATSKSNSFLCKERHVLDFHLAVEMVYTEAQKSISILWGKAFSYEKGQPTEEADKRGKANSITIALLSITCTSFLSLAEK